MTSISLVEKDDAYAVIAKRHAESTEACAAISFIMTALANWAAEHGEIHSILKPGAAQVILPKTQEAAAVMELTETAFEGLAEIGEIALKKVKSLGKI